MNTVCPDKMCNGCGLCAAQCPLQCICFDEGGTFGHKFPHIDQKRCIDCGLCRKFCPALHSKLTGYPVKAYAAWSKDTDDYRTSASGGIASALSRLTIEQGGVVYGCAMLPDIDVQHVRVDKVEDLRKLKGSKYVQSDMTDVYQQLKEDVGTGRMTLFVGTPCQVAAVKALFKEQPDNLLLVDLICHGVPSVKLLRHHVGNVADYPHYEEVTFRESNAYMMKIHAGGEIVYKRPLKKPFYQDWYLNTFVDGYTCRDSCYSCRYACEERISDITIGDFWGLGKKYGVRDIPEHPYGCSVVLPITEKGMEAVRCLQATVYLFERPLDEATDGNAQLQSPVRLDWRKKIFRMLFPVLGRRAYDIVIADKYVRYVLGQLKHRIKK